MSNILLFLLLAFLPVNVFCGSLSISQEGKTSYVIVVPDNPAPVLRTASRELTEHLKQMTTADFPVLEESAYPAGNPAIFIGAVQAGKQIFPDILFQDSKPDTTTVRFMGNDIFLSGRPNSGPLYAVYTFLEDYCGVRWWNLGETDIPDKPTLTVETKDYLYAPVLISREAFYRNARPGIQAARTKSNGHFSLLTPEYGDRMYIIGQVHTFNQFLPPKEHFASHPEWYSLLNGKRCGHVQDTQLCITNEAMTSAFIESCLEQIKKYPSAGMISVSQNDSHGDCTCECPDCLELTRKLGSKTDAQLWFVNKVAAAIKEKHPDFLVETLAYHYTRSAPKTVRPLDNVIIRLCPIEVNFAQSMQDGPDNADFRRDIQGWVAIAPRLFIWNYVTNFKNYIFPHPNYRNLAEDIRYFVKMGAIGIFEQGDSGCNVGDFVRPRAWILQKLLWNPELDEKKLAREFFQGYYGAAGPYLLEYIDFLCDTVERRSVRLPCIYDTPDFWFSYEDILKARELYAQADKAVAGQKKYSSRVRRERLSLDLAYLNNVATNIRRNRILGIPYDINPEEILKLSKEFIQLTDYWDAGQFRELVAFQDYARVLQQKLKSALEVESWPVSQEIRSLPPTHWDYLPPSFAVHVRVNTWSFFINDKAAPCGNALRIPNTHNQWTFQGQLPAFYSEAHKKWRFFVELRCDANTKEGTALNFGIYDNEAKENLYSREVKVSELNTDQYTVIETPPVALKKDQTFWCAAEIRKPEEVSNVYISSILMVADQE